MDKLLQELTVVSCQQDDGLMEDLRTAAEIIRKEEPPEQNEPETQEEDGLLITVETIQLKGDPLPGVGLFGARIPGGEN